VNYKPIVGLSSILIILVGVNYFANLTSQILIPLFFTVITLYWLHDLTKKKEKEDEQGNEVRYY